MAKAGNIIGIIIGLGLILGPLIGYMGQEASLKDPTTQGILILFALIGAFMVMNNMFKLFEKETTSSASAQPAKVISKAETETEEEPETEVEEKKIRCRFCKKMYSEEYNGCPYCKKK